MFEQVNKDKLKNTTERLHSRVSLSFEIQIHNVLK